MSKQYNKSIKRRRARAYDERKKNRLKEELAAKGITAKKVLAAAR